ncbi:plexin domain-containing protein 2-like [Photinus pyralis]|uniref:PSI domain-containing protein n=1 Tax=Photinus pyralis TaxID=7054 RepID=A0A1Y1MAB1_PHOPY|nr:plexin domain-containing protein 2-like [Photinus pyralis]
MWRKYSAIFILFTLILEIVGNQDKYFYNTDEDLSSDTRVNIEFLHSVPHHLRKRQALPQDLYGFRNKTTTEPPTQSPSVPPVIIPISPASIDKNDTLKKTTTEKSNLTVEKLLGKNLGENGAGIRKNYTIVTTTPTSTTTAAVLTSNTEDHLIVPKVQKNETTNGTTTDESLPEISIDKFAKDSEIFNKTLLEHQVNETKTDAHIYYNSTMTVDAAITEQYWVHFENNSDVRVNDLLSNAYRRAATVKLSFDFPFYGHLVRNITVATGGFIYMGEYLHSWLAATQYIAPLMANFDTAVSNHSFIKYLDNGTAFTVVWEEVHLQDTPQVGSFVFQTTLFKNGDIVFVYKNIPIPVEEIVDDNHPVKVGLSDAYLIDHTIFFVRRKTIYEYHRVNFSKEDIKNDTTIYLKALPTCLDSKDCHSCLTTQIDNFECTWCPSNGRCSNGLDRHKQEWLAKGCDRKQVANESQCYQVDTVEGLNHNDEHNTYYNTDKHIEDTKVQSNERGLPNNQNKKKVNDDDHSQETSFNTVQASRISQSSQHIEPDGDVKMGASGIITILFLVSVITALAVWVLYAYRNPHTTSGQILIRYRPSQWRWKRGEARYTAATIHM